MPSAKVARTESGCRVAGADTTRSAGATARVVSFGAFQPDADAVVVTVSGASSALPGTEPGAVKVTPFSEYPAKGRATGGVRCHRFALVAKDGKVAHIGVEAPGAFEVSKAEAILEKL